MDIKNMSAQQIFEAMKNGSDEFKLFELTQADQNEEVVSNDQLVKHFAAGGSIADAIKLFEQKKQN